MELWLLQGGGGGGGGTTNGYGDKVELEVMKLLCFKTRSLSSTIWWVWRFDSSGGTSRFLQQLLMEMVVEELEMLEIIPKLEVLQEKMELSKDRCWRCWRWCKRQGQEEMEFGFLEVLGIVGGG